MDRPITLSLSIILGVGFALALSACGNDSGSVSINNGTSSGSVAAPNAAQSVAAELTNKQGLALLKELQTKPNRSKTLTPAELRFLAKVQLAEKERKARN